MTTAFRDAIKLRELQAQYPDADRDVIRLLWEQAKGDVCEARRLIGQVLRPSSDAVPGLQELAVLKAAFPSVDEEVVKIVLQQCRDLSAACNCLESLEAPPSPPSHLPDCHSSTEAVTNELAIEFDSVEPALVAILVQECLDRGSVDLLQDSRSLLALVSGQTPPRVPLAASEALIFLKELFEGANVRVDDTLLQALLDAYEGDLPSAVDSALSLLAPPPALRPDACLLDPVLPRNHVLRPILDHLAELLPQHDPYVLVRAIEATQGNMARAADLVLREQASLPEGPAPSAPSFPVGEWGKDLSLPLKLQWLKDEYCNVDTELLHDLLHLHQGHLGRTQAALQHLLGVMPLSSGAPAPVPPPVPDPPRLSSAPTYRDPSHPVSNSTRLPLPPPTTSLPTPSAQLAHLHAAHRAAAQRAHCFAQAAQAFARGDRAAAAHWATEGRKWGVRVQQSQSEAAQDTAEQLLHSDRTKVLDLHGFHVQPALALLKQVVEQLSERGVGTLKVITGAGHHSSTGARLKPAVQHYLRTMRLSHCAEGDGAFLVRIPKR